MTVFTHDRTGSSHPSRVVWQQAELNQNWLENQTALKTEKTTNPDQKTKDVLSEINREAEQVKGETQKQLDRLKASIETTVADENTELSIEEAQEILQDVRMIRLANALGVHTTDTPSWARETLDEDADEDYIDAAKKLLDDTNVSAFAPAVLSEITKMTGGTIRMDENKFIVKLNEKIALFLKSKNSTDPEVAKQELNKAYQQLKDMLTPLLDEKTVKQLPADVDALTTMDAQAWAAKGGNMLNALKSTFKIKSTPQTTNAALRDTVAIHADALSLVDPNLVRKKVDTNGVATYKIKSATLAKRLVSTDFGADVKAGAIVGGWMHPLEKADGKSARDVVMEKTAQLGLSLSQESEEAFLKALRDELDPAMIKQFFDKLQDMQTKLDSLTNNMGGNAEQVASLPKETKILVIGAVMPEGVLNGTQLQPAELVKNGGAKLDQVLKTADEILPLISALSTAKTLEDVQKSLAELSSKVPALKPQLDVLAKISSSYKIEDVQTHLRELGELMPGLKEKLNIIAGKLEGLRPLNTKFEEMLSAFGAKRPEGPLVEPNTKMLAELLQNPEDTLRIVAENSATKKLLDAFQITGIDLGNPESLATAPEKIQTKIEEQIDSILEVIFSSKESAFVVDWEKFGPHLPELRKQLFPLVAEAIASQSKGKIQILDKNGALSIEGMRKFMGDGEKEDGAKEATLYTVLKEHNFDKDEITKIITSKDAEVRKKGKPLLDFIEALGKTGIKSESEPAKKFRETLGKVDENIPTAMKLKDMQSRFNELMDKWRNGDVSQNMFGIFLSAVTMFMEFSETFADLKNDFAGTELGKMLGVEKTEGSENTTEEANNKPAEPEIKDEDIDTRVDNILGGEPYKLTRKEITVLKLKGENVRMLDVIVEDDLEDLADDNDELETALMKIKKNVSDEEEAQLVNSKSKATILEYFEKQAKAKLTEEAKTKAAAMKTEQDAKPADKTTAGADKSETKPETT